MWIVPLVISEPQLPAVSKPKDALRSSLSLDAIASANAGGHKSHDSIGVPRPIRQSSDPSEPARDRRVQPVESDNSRQAGGRSKITSDGGAQSQKDLALDAGKEGKERKSSNNTSAPAVPALAVDTEKSARRGKHPFGPSPASTTTE
jgi:hypothetical protein